MYILTLRLNKLKSFEEKRKAAKKYKLYLLKSELIFLLLGLLIEIFIDGGFLCYIIIIFFLLKLFHWNKKYKRKFFILEVAFLILFPVMTMLYSVSFSPSNIIGLNKQNAEIITAKDTIKTEIIFSDNSFFYTQDVKDNKILTINKIDVKKLTTVPSDSNLNQRTTVYQWAKHFFITTKK